MKSKKRKSLKSTKYQGVSEKHECTTCSNCLGELSRIADTSNGYLQFICFKCGEIFTYRKRGGKDAENLRKESTG